MSSRELYCGSRKLDLRSPCVMGVLNITPDSFSDGGSLHDGHSIQWSTLMEQAQHMLDSGAAVLDVGGESTRPGAEPVATQEECDRVLPVIERLCAELPVVVSVDTSNPAVMAEAVRLGAGLINDVRALRAEGALTAAASTDVPICLMHIGGSGEPNTMQAGIDHSDWSERDIVAEINSFFEERIEAVQAAGIAKERLLLDPGFGFGKRDADNMRLIQSLHNILGGYPVLVGVSRKSSIGRLLNQEDAERRLEGALVLEMAAVRNGARIIRTHEVASTVQALKMHALLEGDK